MMKLSTSSSLSKKEGVSSSPSKRSAGSEIDPPRLHRDMKLICDVFRISEQSRHALRTFDCTVLEDFSFMTDEDFADMIVSRARLNTPIPPLQQRKLHVLLKWVRSIQLVEHDACEALMPPPVNESEGFEVNRSNKARYKVSVRKDDNICYIPSDWEDRFYKDLPRLKRELKQMGGSSNASNWANNFLSLRWLFCKE